MLSAVAQESTLRDFVRVLQRRRWVFFSIAGCVFTAAIALCLLVTPRYSAISTVQLQRSSSNGLNLDSILGSNSADSADSLTANLDLQTEASVLRSSEIELKVIHDLDLEDKPEFRPRAGRLGRLLGPILKPPAFEPLSVPIGDTRFRRDAVLQIFAKNLDVRVVPGTRLLQVSYLDRDPRLAAEIVNHLIQGLIDFTFQTRYRATNEVSEWLEVQLGDLRKRSEDLQAKVVAMQKATGLFGAGGVDQQGRSVVYSPVLDRLQQSTAELSQAELNRVLKGAVDRVVQSGDPELISQLSGTAVASGAGQGVVNSLQLIQSLRTQESSLKEQIDRDASVLGPNYPKLIEEKASLSAVEQSLKAEDNRLATRAHNDYVVAEQSERGARAAYEADRAAAEKLNDRTIAYNLVQKEAEQSQALYQDLSRRLKEAGILEGLHSSNITVIDKAYPPALPAVPNRKLYILGGLIIGLLAALLGTFAFDALDNIVRGPEDIAMVDLPLLGLLPEVTGIAATGMFVSREPRSNFAENLRSVRSAILLSRSDRPPQVILITSSTPGEGKTTISLNLASILAQQRDKRVLIMEADLRRPTIVNRLHLAAPTPGLSQLLSSSELPRPVAIDSQKSLFVVPAGPVPPFPAELLGSSRMVELVESFRSEFDFIVIDTPPLLPVTDARLIVPLADATLIVARANNTTRSGLQRCLDVFRHSLPPESRNYVGVVLNSVGLRSMAYTSYYGDSYAEYYSAAETKS